MGCFWKLVSRSWGPLFLLMFVSLGAQAWAQGVTTQGSSGGHDPVYDECMRSHNIQTQYDCDCLDREAVASRERLSDKRLQAQISMIPRAEGSIKNMENSLATETDAQKIENYKRSIQSTQDHIAKLKIRPDPQSHDMSHVMSELVQNNYCKK